MVSVRREEALVFALGALAGEIALHEHRIEIPGRKIVDHPSVHDLRVWFVAGFGREHRTEFLRCAEQAAGGLAEVHVVDRAETSEALARRRSEGSDGAWHELGGLDSLDAQVVDHSRLKSVDRGVVVRAGSDNLAIADRGGDRFGRVGDERDDDLVGPHGEQLGIANHAVILGPARTTASR
jgi:hypothetical protein